MNNLSHSCHSKQLRSFANNSHTAWTRRLNGYVCFLFPITNYRFFNCQFAFFNLTPVIVSFFPEYRP